MQCISQNIKGIYTHIDAKGRNVGVKKKAPTPEEIVRLGVEGIIKIWKDAKLRGNGHKKAMLILAAAMRSIGLKSRSYRSPDGDTGFDRGL